jgi:hypothetical protein
MGTIHVLCEEGDISIVWNQEDEESTKKAAEEFKRLKADGYELYAPGKGGARGKRLQRFSKKLGAIIAAPGVKTEEDKQQGTRRKSMGGGPVAASSFER